MENSVKRKMIIFGATGGTGSHILQQALEQGYKVTAFVRNPQKLQLRHEDFTLIQGDVLDYAAVEKAVKGHDVVLCAIGSPANKIGVVRSQGTLNIINAMQKAGVKRLICQTSLGYGDSVALLKQTPFIFRNIIVPFVLKKGFADHALQESYIKKSNLDWVIVRPGNLTDGVLTGKYQHGFPATQKGLEVKVSRADVAHFILRQVDNNTYLRMTPSISY